MDLFTDGDEMNQLREDVEKRFQVMNETVEGMTETLQTRITALSETVNNEIQHATGVRHQRPGESTRARC